MESSRRSRRHRNLQAQEPQQAEHQPFFSKTAVGATIQTKPESAFFQAKLTIGQPDDQYEKEADSVADKVVSPPAPKGSFATVQRLATPDEKNMPATNDARMAEDKNIQEKPVHRAEKKEEEKPKERRGSDKDKEKEKEVEKEEEKKEVEKKVQIAEGVGEDEVIDNPCYAPPKPRRKRGSHIDRRDRVKKLEKKEI